jgi:peptidoglycan/xylan/chitin deacetylase (PgdA/CDA1 family)
MNIPVLLYHNVASRSVLAHLTKRDAYYSFELEEFSNHIKYLSQNGFETISTENDIEPATNPVMLTFDDGFSSNFDCFKLLRAYGFTAIFFIATEFLGNDRYLTWDQLREMQKGGMSIQSHTCSHPILTEITMDQVRFEFSDSKRVIEENLNREVNSISIPQGFVNNEIIDIAKDCNYKYIFTSEPGLYDDRVDGAVKRLSIYRTTTMSQFQRLVKKNYYEINKQKIYKKFLSVPKRILGDRNYHLFRSKILERLK